MIRHLLVPLDGSALAESVLPCAQEFAHLTGAEVTLLRAVDPPATLGDPVAAEVAPIALDLPAAGEGVAIYRIVDREATAYLITVAQQFARAGIVTHTRVVPGPAAEAIIEAAQGCDLVAMATHGRSGIGRWVLGSVADRVLRGAPVPVLLICVDQSEIVATGYPRRILVPLDGSALAEQALPLAAALARRAGANLILTRSLDPARPFSGLYAAFGGPAPIDYVEMAEADADANLGTIRARLTEQGFTVETDLRQAAAGEGILTSVAERGADLIVMSTHGRGGLRRWMLGSVAERARLSRGRAAA